MNTQLQLTQSISIARQITDVLHLGRVLDHYQGQLLFDRLTDLLEQDNELRAALHATLGARDTGARAVRSD